MGRESTIGFSFRVYSFLPPSSQVSKLANGVTVASVENNSVNSNVAVLVRAGSRVESYEQRGLTHLMRNSAFLVRKSKTQVDVV